MAQHTVFGSGTPPYLLTAYSDGTPNIVLGNYLYTYGAMASGWYCAGGRVYIPNDPSVFNQSITIKAWVSTTAAVDLSTAPLVEKVTTTSANAGWAEVTWDTPFALNPGDLVFIGYEFVDPQQMFYVHAASPQGHIIRSVDDVDLVLAEADISFWYRIVVVGDTVLVLALLVIQKHGMARILSSPTKVLARCPSRLPNTVLTRPAAPRLKTRPVTIMI